MSNNDKRNSCAAELTGNEIIHVDCVDHVYPDGSMSLESLCFSVYPGEIVALCGPNGSGKTTLLEHLVGIKAGHLLFHIEKLREAGYITQENKKYLITLNGRKALSLISGLRNELIFR